MAMLRFKTDQRDSLAETLRFRALRDHWLKSFPGVFVPMAAAEVMQLVSAALSIADARRIGDEADIVTWADLCVLARTDFAAGLRPDPSGRG
jgi:hypothetical protein